MDFKDFVQHISFHYMQPNAPLVENFVAYADFQLINTNLPEDEQRIKRLFRPLMPIPKMSTFALGAIIQKGVAELNNNESFINIGVWNGFTFFSGLIGNPDVHCVGVDNYCQSYDADIGNTYKNMLHQFERLKSPGHHFFHMDYIDYFQQVHQETIGFYLFDGPHDYKNQLDGVKIAEPFFSEKCIILIDDTNFKDVRQATLDFIETSSNSYEIILDQMTSDNCHPTFWNGVMILQRI